MDKFAIDLDSILDELEENDDVSDRGHPPSLVKIANCNTFGFNNNFPSIHSYCDDSRNRSSHQSANDGIGCSTSSATNSYKRQMFSPYIDSRTIDLLDSSEAEFGISIKPIETQSHQNEDPYHENRTTYDFNKDVNQTEKNRLFTSLLEKAKWNTEDTTQNSHEYYIDTTSSDEEVSDDVLNGGIEQTMDVNNHQKDDDLGDDKKSFNPIEIKTDTKESTTDSTLEALLTIDSGLKVNPSREEAINLDSSKDTLCVDSSTKDKLIKDYLPKETLNVDPTMNETLTVDSTPEEELNVDSSTANIDFDSVPNESLDTDLTSDKTIVVDSTLNDGLNNQLITKQSLDSASMSDGILSINSDLNITESNQLKSKPQSEECCESNQLKTEESIDNSFKESNNQISSVTELESGLVIETETNLFKDESKDESDAKWETDSIKNNFDDTTNVVKFSDIEVNIDDLTEHDINQYLSEFDIKELCEDNDIKDTNIESNINVESFSQSNSDSTNEELLVTNSDKELNSMSQSTSSVSIEENDKISDISDFDVSQQKDISIESNETNDNQLNDSESVPQTADIPYQTNRIARPNTLPISSNPINVNTIETNGVIDEINDENNNDSNNNESDNNNVSNDEEVLPNGLNSDFDEHDLTLGLSEGEQMLGKVKPFWIPDNETQMCMHCDIKFNLIKRRHHCRACGKVLCAQCCNSRAKLLYLDNEVARVCQICYSTLARIAAIERNANHNNSFPLGPDNLYPDSSPSDASNFRSPDPNNPLEYCSTVCPLDQEQDILNRPPPSVMVPVGVLKRGDRPKGEPKQVVFSDGIRPGGDLTETGEGTSSLAFLRRAGRAQLKLKSPPVDSVSSTQSIISSNKTKATRIVITDSNGTLPPIINYNDLNYNKSVKNKPSILNLIEFLKNKDLCPVVFALTKNLHIFAKIVFKDCCVHSECWTFATKGMGTIGQDEILVTLDRLPEEETFPRDIFRLFTFVYDSASKGTAFNDLSHAFFPDGLFGNKDNSGFLFARPTLQCFNGLVLPSPPFLLAILIHKWEIPWAKVFPLRLLLRLGAEYKYYPSPIVSYRSRKPVYCEIGHTIMNVLADFRNFQYTLPTVPGLTIHLEDKQISVDLPRNRYEKVHKVLQNSNEHVLAFGANFSLKADSHLVCMQNDVDGQYQTQSINIEGAPRKITGASFIVFSGALKSSTGLTAKMSIVEDGLLVQIPPNTMTEMRSALKDMKDYAINCGKVDSEPDEVIRMIWTEEDTNVNLGVRSPIDGTNLEGIQSIRIYNGTDYTNDKLVIRWTEVFFLRINEMSRRTDSLDANKLAEMISQAFCLALTSCLDQLFESGFTKIGLRINLDSDKVGYEVGSNGQCLPPQYATELDSALIPVIMDNISTGVEDQLIMELLFHILVK